MSSYAVAHVKHMTSCRPREVPRRRSAIRLRTRTGPSLRHRVCGGRTHGGKERGDHHVNEVLGEGRDVEAVTTLGGKVVEARVVGSRVNRRLREYDQTF